MECYRSAEKQKKTADKYGSDGFSDSMSFYPADRLLHVKGGQMGDNEILLGQGHEKLQVVPLLIYCLIQCDALRPIQGTFRPSIDARVAAAANMGNMSPSALSRCIAPRIELWTSGADAKEPVCSSMGMSLNDIKFTVIDLSVSFMESPSQSTPKPVLLLDSPREVAIYDCSVFVGAEMRVKQKEIPNKLRKAAHEAKESYRVRPFSAATNEAHLTSPLEVGHHFRDALVEDSSISGQTYDQWLTLIAEVLHR